MKQSPVQQSVFITHAELLGRCELYRRLVSTQLVA